MTMAMSIRCMIHQTSIDFSHAGIISDSTGNPASTCAVMLVTAIPTLFLYDGMEDWCPITAHKVIFPILIDFNVFIHFKFYFYGNHHNPCVLFSHHMEQLIVVRIKFTYTFTI